MCLMARIDCLVVEYKLGGYNILNCYLILKYYISIDGARYMGILIEFGRKVGERVRIKVVLSCFSVTICVVLTFVWSDIITVF